MEWKFHDDGKVFLTQIPDIDHFRNTPSFDNTKHVINLLPKNSCMTYLGIESASSGNQDSQLKCLIQIANTGARTLDTNNFGRYHSKIYINTYLNPKLYYPFTCSSLTPKQYISINTYHVPSTLLSMGFNKTLTLSLRYGCHSYGGLQLKHPYVKVLIRKISTVFSLPYLKLTQQPPFIYSSLSFNSSLVSRILFLKIQTTL